MENSTTIECLIGTSANREVLIGYAPANFLYTHSFADVLSEDTRLGYQRPFNSRHSQDFRKYIKADGATTIPLTLNLRPSDDGGWSLARCGRHGSLHIRHGAGKVMAQVDCQHRLGHLNDVSIELPFMCFIGLTQREEMEIFNVINGKAKGLSSSLLDFHDAQFACDLAAERPELFIALHLNNAEDSPWRRKLNLGGESTSGLMRVASLRMMQLAVQEFLKETKLVGPGSAEIACQLVHDFWKAIVEVLPNEWAAPRQHLLTKGVGIYSLMYIAADIVNDARAQGQVCSKRQFVSALSDFSDKINWTNVGDLRGLGGKAGVKAAISILRDARHRGKFKVVSGQ